MDDFENCYDVNPDDEGSDYMDNVYDLVERNEGRDS